MAAKNAKILTVPANGQISIGKSWAGRHILIEEISPTEIKIRAGTFIPDSQKVFYSPEAQKILAEFNAWESAHPPEETDTKSLFSRLKKKARKKSQSHG